MEFDAIATMFREALTGSAPYLSVAPPSDTSISSAFVIRGSFDPRETWQNGIRENGRYFTFMISVKGKRYHTPGDALEVSLIADHTGRKFRKASGTPEKLLQKLKDFLIYDFAEKPTEV